MFCTELKIQTINEFVEHFFHESKVLFYHFSYKIEHNDKRQNKIISIEIGFENAKNRRKNFCLSRIHFHLTDT